MHKPTSRPVSLYSVLLLSALLGALSIVSGCATAPAESENRYENSNEKAPEPVIAKSEWLESLHFDLTQDLCAEDTVFRACYPVSEQDCRERAESVASACESEYQPDLPEELSDVDGARWGGRIGKCAGEGLFNAVDANYTFNETENCQRLLSDM